MRMMITSTIVTPAITIMILAISAVGMIMVVVAQQAHAQAVPLIKINTGDKSEDKLIQKFYNCFLKFSHPDPTGPQVKNCYIKTFGGLTK